jgi:hypothetical protein
MIRADCGRHSRSLHSPDCDSQSPETDPCQACGPHKDQKDDADPCKVEATAGRSPEQKQQHYPDGEERQDDVRGLEDNHRRALRSHECPSQAHQRDDRIQDLKSKGKHTESSACSQERNGQGPIQESQWREERERENFVHDGRRDTGREFAKHTGTCGTLIDDNRPGGDSDESQPCHHDARHPRCASLDVEGDGCAAGCWRRIGVHRRFLHDLLGAHRGCPTILAFSGGRERERSDRRVRPTATPRWAAIRAIRATVPRG